MKRLAVFLLGGVLGGCALGPVHRPDAGLVAPADVGVTGETTAPIDAEWWHAFNDPALDALVTRALAHAPGVEAAEARLTHALAGLDVASAARRPTIDAGASLDREHFSERSFYPPPYGGNTYWNGSVLGVLHWDADLWGRQRSRIDAAIDEARARRIELRSTRLLLEAAVVTAWIDLDRALRARDRALETVALAERELALARRRAEAGLDAGGDVARPRGNLETARTEFERASVEVELAHDRLGALTGDGARTSVDATPHLAVAALAVPKALPGDLLARRGDVKAGRLRVEALLAREHVASLARYPSLDLHAFAGTTAFGLPELFSGPARTMGAGAQLALPMFDTGTLRGTLAASHAEVDGAIAAYHATVLEAVRETADLLARIRGVDASLDEAGRVREARAASETQARRRHEAGLAPEAAVLQAALARVAAQSRVDDLTLTAAALRVALLVAVGGSADDPSFLTTPTIPGAP
jgi:NodT family efflux transporter outer membrane factor (OMF) lipoprotein